MFRELYEATGLKMVVDSVTDPLMTKDDWGVYVEGFRPKHPTYNQDPQDMNHKRQVFCQEFKRVCIEMGLCTKDNHDSYRELNKLIGLAWETLEARRKEKYGETQQSSQKTP